MQGRKSNQKSRNSTAKKSQTTKKPINQKDKIANAIKKSTLLTSNTMKTRIPSNTKLPKTEKKVSKNPYQIQSYRNKTVKALSNVSKSMPLKSQKPKTMEFPFEAIKFKQKIKEQVIPSKTHDEFYIQYDQPEQTQTIDMSVLNNSKKILGSYNQRVGRYNQLKSKHRGQFPSQIKDFQFKQALIKLFKFLDPHSNMVISHEQIDYRKLPQGVLYLLGGLFHRIRQKNLLLSQNDFLEECSLLYKRSSNEDVKWFIDEVFALESNFQQNCNKKAEPKIFSNCEFGIINQECLNKIRHQEGISTKNLSSLVSACNNLSLDLQEKGMSFRNQTSQQEYTSKESNPSEKESVKSPHFGQLYNRFSFNNKNREQLLIKIQDQEHLLKESQKYQNKKSQRNSLSQHEQKQIQKVKTVGIKKNIVDKAQDLREQIYAKMDKMKLYPQNKQNLLLIKENFTCKSKPIQYKNSNLKQPLNQNSQNQIQSNSSNTLKIKEKQNIDFIQPKQSKKNKINYLQSEEKNIEVKSNFQNREPLVEKNTGWVQKISKCQKAFDQLKKIQQEFKIQKKIVEKKQSQRQSYIRQNQKKAHHLMEDFILQDQTRFIKLTNKKGIFQKPSQRQSLKYERNIDRLAILSNSRNQNSRTINLNESLANSCRKSLEVSIPLRHEGQKILSLSEKKSTGHQRFDKIEQLSQRLEKYLKNNAQKIEYSKNFTQTPIQVGYNKILAI